MNEDGTPKMMYLGTDSGGGEVAPNGEGGRYYLAPDEARARQYGETVIEVYANAAEGIQADGTVIVQGAEHIKAVENQGTFDARNPAIRYSLVEEGVWKRKEKTFSMSAKQPAARRNNRGNRGGDTDKEANGRTGAGSAEAGV